MVNFKEHKIGLFATPISFEAIMEGYFAPNEKAIAAQAAALAWNYAMQYAEQLQAADRKELEG